MKIKLDFHGYRVEQARRAVEDLVFDRDGSEYYEIELITGHGKIREVIADFLDSEGIEWMSGYPNHGLIRFQLEQEDF